MRPSHHFQNNDCHQALPLCCAANVNEASGKVSRVDGIGTEDTSAAGSAAATGTASALASAAAVISRALCAESLGESLFALLKMYTAPPPMLMSMIVFSMEDPYTTRRLACFSAACSVLSRYRIFRLSRSCFHAWSRMYARPTSCARLVEADEVADAFGVLRRRKTV